MYGFVVPVKFVERLPGHVSMEGVGHCCNVGRCRLLVGSGASGVVVGVKRNVVAVVYQVCY